MAEKVPGRADLTDAEWKVMKEVWTLKKTNVREVFEALQDSEGWAYNTVRTLMERLAAKGHLTTKKVGNMYFYTPARSRSSVSAQALWDFVDKVFDGAAGPLVSYAVQEKKLTGEELDALRRLLDAEGGKS
jgi:predicted transcriptional regulator